MVDEIKAILDTDIGDDIDDAFALAMLCRRPGNVNLLGVTTVYRNAYKRAELARLLIKTFKKDIKVYSGENYPKTQDAKELLINTVKDKETVDENGLYMIPQYMDEMRGEDIEKESAVDFIIRMVHTYPHEVVIFAIGPYTNVAFAMEKDPTIIPLIKDIYLMGGDFSENPRKEWNVICDPEACDVVYKSGARIHAVGCDTTLRCKLSNQLVNYIKNSDSDRMSLLYKLMNKWFEFYEFTTPVMHDPLAVSSALTNVCKFELKNVYVELNDKERRGMTLINNKKGNPIYVAVDVDVTKFTEFFMQRVFGSYYEEVKDL